MVLITYANNDSPLGERLPPLNSKRLQLGGYQSKIFFNPYKPIGSKYMPDSKGGFSRGFSKCRFVLSNQQDVL